MKLSYLSSILAIVAGINIFYALFSMTQKQIFNTLMFILSFLTLIYAAAILEKRIDEEIQTTD
jgi:hypothetical protein